MKKLKIWMKISNKKTYSIGHDSQKLMKRMAYYDKYYENMKFYDLVASVLSTLKCNIWLVNIM